MPTCSLSPHLWPFRPHTYTKMKVEYPPGVAHTLTTFQWEWTPLILPVLGLILTKLTISLISANYSPFLAQLWGNFWKLLLIHILNLHLHFVRGHWYNTRSILLSMFATQVPRVNLCSQELTFNYSNCKVTRFSVARSINKYIGNYVVVNKEERSWRYGFWKLGSQRRSCQLLLIQCSRFGQH